MMVTNIYAITFDEPNPSWLCADNLAVALHAYCKNIKFHVEQVKTQSNKLIQRRGISACESIFACEYFVDGICTIETDECSRR